jgi:hypothetical protein
MFKNTIAYSFGKNTKELTFNEKKEIDVPGPGRYDESALFKIKDRTKSFSFGKSAKFPKNKTITPGPGQYTGLADESFVKSKSPCFSIGKSERPKEIYLNSSYSNRSFFQETPGPGQYKVEMSTIEKYKSTRAPAYKIGKSPKFIEISTIVPGPGDYSPERLSFKKKNPSWSLPKSKKNSEYLIPKCALESPGPGRYNNTNSVFDFSPKKTGFKYFSPKKTNVSMISPGPGDYNIPNTIGYTPSYVKLATAKKIYLNSKILQI